ncbi:MAG: hypothetical protein ACRDJV_08500 [Actinomycetota bacterium]
MNEPTPESSIPRRKLLKRIGAGAAIVWSAPVLTSLTAPALAQNYGGLCRTCGCLGDPSNLECGSNPLLDCNCILSVVATCECVDLLNDGGACGPGDTCAPDYVCVQVCDSQATRCLARCA